MKKIIAGLSASLLAATTLAPAISAQEAISRFGELGQTPKNVILLIPDGMGTNDIMAYRQYKDGGYKANQTRTIMDEYLAGEMITSPEETEEAIADGASTVTDSAAAGTAMATGEKTYSGGIAVDNDGSDLESISEVAKANGRSVGIVATSDVLHATPAVFHSHVESRKDYDGMVAEMVEKLEADQELPFDILLGGGQQYFAEHTELFQDKGYAYVETAADLEAAEGEKILGLFAEDALPYHFDTVDENTPTLAEMTTAAINTLSTNEEGFFLMIEASQIDWANHANDLTGMMSEIAAYEEAFQAAIDFAKEDGETLVIAAADHETGGFTVSGKQEDGSDEQQFIIDPIVNIKHSPAYLASLVEESGDVEETLAEHIDWKFNNEEISAMEDALTMGEGAGKIESIIIKAINLRTNAGWSSSQHTGGEVSFYAYGPGFENFIGLIDNTDVAKFVKGFITGEMPEAAEEEVAEEEAPAEEETVEEETVEEEVAEEETAEESVDEESAEESVEEESAEESVEETTEAA